MRNILFLVFTLGIEGLEETWPWRKTDVVLWILLFAAACAGVVAAMMGLDAAVGLAAVVFRMEAAKAAAASGDATASAEAKTTIAKLERLEWACEWYEKTRQLAKRLMEWVQTEEARKVIIIRHKGSNRSRAAAATASSSSTPVSYLMLYCCRLSETYCERFPW